MALPSKQNPLDWITQYWNIALGRKIDGIDDGWLVGPIGNIAEDATQLLDRLAIERSLRIGSDSPSSGLVQSLDDWNVEVRPEIEDFYLRTSQYDLTVRTAWRPVFGSLGYLVAKLFSRRIQQLNLPQGSSDESKALRNEVIQLFDADHKLDTTVWKRSLSDSGDIVFFGVYTTCRIPSGALCVKAIFPLPRGSATVIFQPASDEQGNLMLTSSGNTYGDPGFYFLVKDSGGFLWKHYLRSFREEIYISADENSGELKAEHTLTLWSMKVYNMTYSITKSSKGGPS